MARKVTTMYIDDIDGSEAEGSVVFSFEGQAYEIDLSSANREKLAGALEPYMQAGRRIGAPRQSNTRRSGTSDLREIREWAAQRGIAVSARGRVSQSVIDQYRAAH